MEEIQKLTLEYFLSEKHEFYKENRCLYRHVFLTTINDYIKELKVLHNKDISERNVHTFIFDTAYILLRRIETDECPFTKVDTYYNSIAKTLMEMFHLDSEEYESYINNFTRVILGITYCLLDIKQEIRNKDKLRDMLQTIQVYDAMQPYVKFTASDKWQECKKRWVSIEETEVETNHTPSQYEISAEKWVELYGNKIQHNFKDQSALVDYIKKLRARYEDAVSKSQKENRKKWKTGFLRDNVCGPKVTWIKNRLDISLVMIEDLFGKKSFTASMLSRSK